MEDIKLTSKIIKERGILIDPNKVFTHKIEGVEFDYKLLNIDSISSMIGPKGKLTNTIVTTLLSQSLWDEEEKRFLTRQEIRTFFSGKMTKIAFEILKYIMDESALTDIGREKTESFRQSTR
ncbi:MAG: hypothetical protein ISP01_09540 [Methanobrevibacter arboriphilus]|uniref:Uncharacterized protein n=1 Tax=Methanobrevibacter arboriphilus TaxID=39441 RepID=A0A843AIC1_METAZ|nr:hypothetical protein [Methanobrevibacter arboriphilus]MBF4469633.1 hypothetical protein [Methanobrevibacter arboriphilus]